MLTTVFRYSIDVAIFAVLASVAAWLIHRSLRRNHHGGLPKRGWVAVAAAVIFGLLGADFGDNFTRNHLREGLIGLAPTYGQEMELLGHENIKFDTPADSPEYLKFIEAEKRWLRVNANVSDIYTYRRKPDGTIAFVVDSETDYNHNGRIDEDREQRTAIGEPYPQATPLFAAALDGKANFDGVPYTDRWGTWISAYVPLHDKSGRVDAALGVDYDARRWNQDIFLSRMAALGMAGILLAMSLGTTAVLTISKSETAKRAVLQRQLMDASRQAGMAEVATGVLHNVGNVLNSVNVSAGVLAEKMRRSKVSGFGKAAGMIREHRDDFAEFVATDDKGKLLPDYLLKLSDLLTGEQQDWLGELSSLTRNLDHVKQIVASQQNLAKKTVSVAETFEISDVCDDAVRMTQASLEKHGVTLKRAIFACPSMKADRHTVLQILVNLMTNAIRAMHDCPIKVLTLSVETGTDPDGTRVAKFRVADTGCGISGEVLGKLFTHGFTTNADGHGFGLHHSANAAQTMHGRIAASSDGHGHGATFTLTLPLVVSEKGSLCQTA
ncbi:MAG: HAMP domain-containing sensor histidine kinase [Tepidisphaeraceae bacterium]